MNKTREELAGLTSYQNSTNCSILHNKTNIITGMPRCCYHLNTFIYYVFLTLYTQTKNNFETLNPYTI